MRHIQITSVDLDAKTVTIEEVEEMTNYTTEANCGSSAWLKNLTPPPEMLV